MSWMYVLSLGVVTMINCNFIKMYLWTMAKKETSSKDRMVELYKKFPLWPLLICLTFYVPLFIFNSESDWLIGKRCISLNYAQQYNNNNYNDDDDDNNTNVNNNVDVSFLFLSRVYMYWCAHKLNMEKLDKNYAKKLIWCRTVETTETIQGGRGISQKIASIIKNYGILIVTHNYEFYMIFMMKFYKCITYRHTHTHTYL